MGTTSRGLGLLLVILLSLSTCTEAIRVRRQVSGTQSLLTVEWEGIQTGDHPDSDINGFLVEYRAENEQNHNVHAGIIPYKGPNHQYRVQIPRLPTGISYFVRIKVLGQNGQVLVETPEIRARNEVVSIKCDSDELTSPRSVEVTQAGNFSLALTWDVPECGSIGDYQVEVTGLGDASFDVHRQTIAHPSVSVVNLLPGTLYSIKVRASDRNRNQGPWTTEVLEARTQGSPLTISPGVQIEYRTDSSIRITWEHLDDERLQHYEVMAVEQGDDSLRVERARVGPHENSHVLSGLRPNTKYLIGVVAFVDHEPKQVYRLSTSTAQTGAVEWRERPNIVDEGAGHMTIHWTVPPVTDVSKFVVEYRLPNENQWRLAADREFDGSVGDYHVTLSDLVDVPFYAIRIVAVDEDNKATTATNEYTVGKAAEGACLGLAGTPDDVRVHLVSDQRLSFVWDKPECDDSIAPIDGYEYILWDANTQSPDGASYVGATAVTVNDLRPNTRYSLKVRSRSGNGHSAWSTPVQATTQAAGALQAGQSQPVNRQIQVEQPRIEQQGPRSTIYWTVQGDTSNVFGYQAEIRTQKERDWKSAGELVRNEPSQQHFRQLLGALPASPMYFVRVRAIDGSMTTLATSPSASFSVSCQTPLSPENVRLDRVAEGIVRLSWTAHEEDASCQGLFYVTGTVSGRPINQRVNGNDRSVDINGGAGDWVIEVRPVNKAGSGPSSQQVYLSNNAQQSLVSTPRVSTRGNDLHVEWKSEGEGRGVFGYRVQFRNEQSGWNPYGQIVPYTGDNQQYAQTLTGLQMGHTYYVHIQVLDRNSYVMYTSPENSATSECKAPTHAPSHLQISAPDSGHVRTQWALPPQSTWGCADIQFEIMADEPAGQQPVVVSGGTTNHIFKSHPNQNWALKIRAKNSAGHSAWTPVTSVRTPAAGELIIGPNVNYRGGAPIISWHSKEGIDQTLVSSYVLEWKSQREDTWRQHANQIPFSGSQRSYQIDLTGLPKGQTYQARVIAKSPQGGNAFVSPVVMVETESACQAPRRAPTNLQVTPVGPTQIRLTWAPLHESEWNCDRLWYIVKYSTPKNQGFKNLTQGENSVVFESDPYTKWNFEVQAANPAGESHWSRAETAQTQAAAPGPVSDFRVQPLGPDSVQISWRPPVNPNGQISSYEITYQLTNRGMCEEVREAPRTVQSDRPSFTLTGLHPHSRYRIGVAARSAIAGERVSQEVQTEQAPPAAAPNYLRVDDARADSSVISWQAPACLHTNGEITEYEYEVTPADRRSTVQKSSNNIRGTRAQITNLQPNTRYNVKVRAYSARGAGPWTQDVPFQTAAGQTIVSAPDFVRVVETGNDNAHVLWQSPPPNEAQRVDKYKCKYRPVNSNQPPQERQFPAQSPCAQEVIRRQQLPPTPPGRSYQCGRIDNLQPQQTYDFQVSAHVQGGEWSPWSQPQRTVISEGPVNVLSVQKIGGNDRSLHVKWDVRPDDMARVTGFRLHVEPVDGSARPQTFSVDARTFTYRIDNLRPSTQYRVTVQAGTQKEYCQGTEAIMSTDAAALIALSVAPRVIAEEATSITIEWNSNSRDASGYIVEYRIESGAWQQYPRRIPANPAQTTYTATVDNLPTNSVVDLRVRVVSAQNEQSNPSPEVRGRTKCSPPSYPPQGIRLDAPSTNEVRVGWTRPAKNTWMCDHLNIEISYKVGNGPEKTVPVSGDQTEYKFPSEPNQRWIIKLRATNQVGASSWSAEQSITTRQGTPGSVREMRVKSLSPNEVHVSWLPPLVQRGTIVGYDISYRLKHRLACPEEEPRDVSRDYVTIYNHKDLDYTLTGLLPYSLYEVKVRARTTELGPEETKEVSTEQQPPSSPPYNMELSYALERSLSFQWEAVDCSQRHGHITNYEYEILGQDDWAKLERQIANTSDTKITIEGLTPYTKYVMRVKAYNSIGGGPNTENLVVMTNKADAPLPPQDLVIVQEGTDFFMVSWLPPYPPYGPHDAYKVRHQLLGANGWEEVQHDVKSPLFQCATESPRFCYNVTDREPGNQYRVQVSCRIEGANYGPWSSVVIANTLQVLPDAPRAIELIEKTDHSLHIRWVPPIDPNGHITQYRVSIVSLDDENDKRKTHLVDHPTLTHLFDNLNPETNYNISISAGTRRGFGPEIWTQYATDYFNVPAVIAAPVVTPDGANALDVQWNGVVDQKNRVKGYIIEIRNADTPVWTEIGGLTDHDSVKRTYLKKLTGLDPDTLYFVRIKVVDKNQRVSNASPEAQGRTGCAAPTSPPANVQIGSPSNVQVKFSWQSPIKASWQCSNIKYKLEYINGTNGRQQVDVSSSAIEHLFDSPSNTKWIIRIRTDNEAGSSEWSKELEITTAEGAPGAISDLSATANGPTSAIVSWKPPKLPNGVITGYTLVYKLKSIGECGPRSANPIEKHVRNEEQTLEDLLPDSTYEIHVIAHTTLAGPQSEVVTVKTEEAEPTGAPLNVRVGSITSTRADVTWQQPDCEKRNGKITEYEYEIESVDEWGENNTGSSKSERVNFDQLVPFTEYKFRVRALNARGSGPYTEWITFTTQPAAPPKPEGLQEEATFPHAIEISFLPPTPPHGILDQYKVRYTPSGEANYKEIRVPADRLVCSDAAKRDRLCYRISDLDPEQEIEIDVQGHTQGGAWGEWSDSITAKTHEQNIPVLERELEVYETRPTIIGLKWEGLPAEQANHVVGYVLEFKSEDDDAEWAEYNGITKHRSRQNEYKITVKGLTPSTQYFFRLKVVGKNDKRGSPGPETKAMTSCGRPEEAPSNVKAEPVDFETLKITWTPPSEDTWQCDDVEFIIDFINTTSKGVISISVDSPSELIIPTMPGTKWEIKMRTQTKEEKPQVSPWSDRVSVTTQSLPGELFVTVDPKGPTEAEVNWDLNDKDQKWNYGVDITYKLKQLGGCNEQATGKHEPITKLNVQDKKIMLSDLHPGSVYEVIVTPRRPPSLSSSIVAPKTVRTFRTENDIPTGPPRNIQSTVRKDTELGFKWDAPECIHQNGNITQYEFELSGLEEWNEGLREGITPRATTLIDSLQPGSLYRMKVRAYTAEGPGPWSEPFDIRTTGSELGPPRELTAVQTKSTLIQLTWLPPYPEKALVTAYKVRYSPRADDSNPTEVEISGDELSCSGYKSAIITSDNLCTTTKGLQPSTTYRFAVQGRSASGNWGEWSNDYFGTTRKDDNELLGGSLKLLSAGHDNLKVKWTPPAVIGEKIDKYQLFISVASELDQNPQEHFTSGHQTDYHFRNLDSVTQYNITVQGLDDGSKLWFISQVFSTTDLAEGLLSWLPAPTDLHLIEKSDTMLHVDWVPPEIFDPEKRDLITHYRVTIAPFDPRSGTTGTPKNYTVNHPGNSIKFDGLTPETIYNITVQAGTSSGYGQILWGVYSTLAPGQRHILRLQNRTPTTLTLEWDPVWGTNHRGYVLSCRTTASVYSQVRLGQIRTYDIDDARQTQFTVKGLNPSSVYNCTLKSRDHAEEAWGAYNTLPPGWFMVKNLKQCDKTDFAVSMSWEPIVDNMASHYQVRYFRPKEQDPVWIEETDREAKELLCPKDGCGRLCYLVFNLPHNPNEYIFQVRAKVDGQWNQWKSGGKMVVSEPPQIKKNCCIVPPPYMVENIGAPGTFWEVDVNPAATDKNITRYYVVVDERDPPGDTNWTELTDKVTANRMKIPYYVAASFNLETLPEPRKVKLGNGEVIGGYLNYPLVKGKKYNYEVYTLWNISGDPLVGRLRATPYLTAGWPWWWLLLLLLLLLLLILLCCCLLWCLQRRYRARADHSRVVTNGQYEGQHVPLLKEEKLEGLESMRVLDKRLDDARNRMSSANKGDFEDGYMKGFKDANRLGSAGAARRKMEEDYAASTDRFHEGYAKGLRDAGMSGMSTSMHNLAQRGTTGGGYSAGFMQGFKDGNSGIFGDRVTPSLISRLDEQYPGQDDFKQGFVDGFKEGAMSRTGEKRTFEDSRRLQQSLTELTERLTSLEKTKGDEIHSTKIYHVYNQQPEVAYSTTGQQLAHELEELSTSRRSTLRRHYTPGDYLKYESEEGAYGTMGRNRRSLSASALARDSQSAERTSERQRYASGTGSSYITRSAMDKQGTDTYSKRYNYRSRSDMGSPRRYASQTLLDGSRPGPSTPHARRDALHTLQKELDTLSRSPGGYMSDSGHGQYDTVRSKAKGYSNYDYDTFQSSRQEVRSSTTQAGGAAAQSATSGATTQAVRYPAAQPTVISTATHKIQSTGREDDAGRWADDLIEIVSEPMNKTLDRMRKYSNSMANVEGQSTSGGGEKEVVSEQYHRSYKEEHSSGQR